MKKADYKYINMNCTNILVSFVGDYVIIFVYNFLTGPRIQN
jgi:uncharacterized membrane protein YeaQ/YmgE (transglycosylase-associated protein family)